METGPRSGPANPAASDRPLPVRRSGDHLRGDVEERPGQPEAGHWFSSWVGLLDRPAIRVLRTSVGGSISAGRARDYGRRAVVREAAGDQNHTCDEVAIAWRRVSERRGG